MDKDNSPKNIQNGEYWLLKNFVRASTYVKCDESITYTTHGDFTFLDNLVPLLKRWQAPISIALYAPGNYFEITVNTIMDLRNCQDESALVAELVTFHIYFEDRFFPEFIPIDVDEYERNFDCNYNSDFDHENSTKTLNNLTYPINVGRNLARKGALTHFVLPSDIELYPNPGLIEDFFQMLLKDQQYIQPHK